ncbi:hypothetical protein C8R44DRAFT_887535 [Mycena epipterygia]|nr:hypothetical protein C8R44DRAFT_887535 [Mycena epipterygia]
MCTEVTEQTQPLSFGCDVNVLPGVIERHLGVDTARPDRLVEILCYDISRALVVEWLLGLHSYIPRFLKAEKRFRTALIEVLMFYALLLALADNPHFRAEGAIWNTEETLIYETMDDLQAEWCTGKYEYIPRGRRRVLSERTWRSAEKYQIHPHHLVFPSNYPARPPPLDQVAPATIAKWPSCRPPKDTTSVTTRG